MGSSSLVDAVVAKEEEEEEEEEDFVLVGKDSNLESDHKNFSGKVAQQQSRELYPDRAGARHPTQRIGKRFETALYGEQRRLPRGARGAGGHDVVAAHDLLRDVARPGLLRLLR
jgi:hypothetical protein